MCKAELNPASTALSGWKKLDEPSRLWLLPKSLIGDYLPRINKPKANPTAAAMPTALQGFSRT